MTGRGLQTAPGRVAFALALGETGHDPRIDTGLAETAFDVTGFGLLTATGRVDSVRVPLLAGEVAGDPPRGNVRGLPPPLTARDQRREDDEPDVSNRSVWRLWLSLWRLLHLLLEVLLWQRFRLLCRISPCSF